MSLPLISVVIPAYNAEQTIERCIASVLADPHDAVEIVVVDDGSTDRTAQILQAAAVRYPGLVRVLSQSNSGACAARNAGMEAASGEFIQFLDSDDELIGHKLQQAIVAFQARPELACVYSDMEVVVDASSGRIVSADHENIEALIERRAGHFTCALNTNMPVWRTSFLRASGLFWRENLPCWQESVYYVELLTELESPRQVFHTGSVGVRFHRPARFAGLSSGYWSSRY
ncbi:MAG: glycosyltransferase family 2 protein [Xanthomonadales bacterium]|nr:glycosyltransferase family 2 protein [Xanthomonadales bacterium]